MQSLRRSTHLIGPIHSVLWYCCYLGLLLSLCLESGGCVGFSIADRNRRHLQELRLGMSKQEVLAIMGSPWKTDAYIYQTIPYVVLHYLTQEPADATPAEEDVTLLVLENDRLVGYGDYIRVLFMFLDASVSL